MSVMTSRTVIPAAPRRRAAGARWDDYASCRVVHPSVFSGDSPHSVVIAKGVCQACPVLTSCLSETRKVEGDRRDLYGIFAGLTPEQRRALRFAGLLGQHPDLEQARQLLEPRWRDELVRLRTAAVTPAEMVRQLGTKGLVVDEVTVRLAVWWSGGIGGLLGRRSRGDTRQDWQRIVDDHRDLVVALLAVGATRVDVAAYVGVLPRQATQAVNAIEKTAEGKAA